MLPLDPTRWLDLALASAGAAVLAPLAGAAALAIRLDDGGPVLYRQERIGQGRRQFTLIKLRTMRRGQVTRVGQYLRATGLDEVPQLWNVLRGDLSVVGPRPLGAADVTRLGWDGPDHDDRFAVRPGLTGLVQVLGTTGPEHSRRFERSHAARRSVGLDLGLVALTLVVAVAGKDRARRWFRAAAARGVLRGLYDLGR